MSSHAIHHVTAVTANIGENLRYYTQVLGLRLVKRSVNQDDVSAYHLFYADAVGSPGTDMTFFDWPRMGANVLGMASVAQTCFRIPAESVGFWMERLEEAGGKPVQSTEDGRASIRFTDPEGQHLELVDDSGLAGGGTPWDAQVPAEFAIRGILGVDLASARPVLTREVLTHILELKEGEGDVFTAEGPSSFGRIRIVEPENERMGRLGAGGVHHVAFRVKDDDELLAMKKRVESFGLATSGYVDRFYFHSLYFREPGGILFELATDGPGFASDEDQSTLGEKLALPPFLEPQRQQIEAGLKPLPPI
jgi:glyoxalase family protein